MVPLKKTSGADVVLIGRKPMQSDSFFYIIQYALISFQVNQALSSKCL